MMRAVVFGLALALTVAAAACGPSTSGGNGDGGGNGTPDSGGPPGCQGAGCYNYCPTGTATSITGVATAPNGIDPLPGAIVYVPLEVNEFPPEVRCEVCTQISDTAAVSTVTNSDGSFTLTPVPTFENQPPGATVRVITQKGRFRKVSEVQIDAPCAANFPANANFRLPGRSDPTGLDRIPKIAVATGDYDIMECVLLKLGIENGAFDLYEGATFETGGGSSGGFDALLMNTSLLASYNIVFINCTNDTFEDLLTNPTIRANVDNYVGSGGRLYVTDWSYDWVEQIPAWSPQIDFGPGASSTAPEPMNQAAIGDDGITTEALVLDPGMVAWLNAVEQVTGEAIIGADNRVHIEHFLIGWVMQFMVPGVPDTNTTVWLEGNVSGSGLSGNLPLTTTFDYNACGRVLYSSYHTRGRDGLGFGGPFPGYCPSGEALSPQERVLEYLILHIADCLIVE